jgi:peptide/nickel transport system permease protein
MKARLKLSPSAWIGLVMVGVFVFAGLFGPWLAPYDVGATSLDLEHRFEGPSAAHWLGTDSKGADTLSQLLWGARSALQLSFIVVAIS